MNINDENDIKNAKGHLEWLLDKGIFDDEDEPYIELILKYIENLENKVKRYEYSEIPYLKGYIQGLERGIKENKDKNEFYRASWKEKHYEDYMHPFGLGYDYSKKSYMDINTKENKNEY